MVDECAGPSLAGWLRHLGHDVASVYPDYRGIDDLRILQWAVSESRIIVTCDKDFGELIFKQRNPHSGVILLRLMDETPAGKISILGNVLGQYRQPLEGRFITATESRIRFEDFQDYGS